MKRLRSLACLALLAGSTFARGAIGAGELAPDFPPGVFSDGGHYDLEDFKGKLLVIFFFESECPTCKGMVPQWNKLVAQYKDKPVKFLAVGPHNTLAGVKQYVSETRLAMPVFADNLNVMETMYGMTISLQNVRQFRIVGPDGNVVGYDMTSQAIDAALANVSWKYKDGGYDSRLNGIIEMLEWNQYQPALAQLRPLRKSPAKALAASAEKLYQAVTTEGQAWKAQADELAPTKPVDAFLLYAKVNQLFAGDELAKSVADPMKTLRAAKPVTDEVAARQQYAQLYTALPRAAVRQREQVSQFCDSIATRYPGTPTADKARALSTAIIGATVSGQ